MSLLFPDVCLQCGDSLSYEEEFVCLSCKLDFPYTDDIENGQNALFEKFVFNDKVSSAASLLYFQKQGIVQRLLHQLKYKGNKDLGIYLGNLFAEKLNKLQLDFIIPVPLHPRKQRSRGYNQAAQIAIGISNVLSVPIINPIPRVKLKISQTGKDKLTRWIDMENVYGDSAINLEGYSVLVVDDVITTGATAGMLCDRLATAHVRSIHIACIARGK